MKKNAILMDLEFVPYVRLRSCIDDIRIESIPHLIQDFHGKQFHIYFKLLEKKYFIFCQVCGNYRASKVLHIDKNFQNNALENLVLACKPCSLQFSYPFKRYIQCQPL